MARGDGQDGKRRGKYRPRAKLTIVSPDGTERDATPKATPPSEPMSVGRPDREPRLLEMSFGPKDKPDEQITKTFSLPWHWQAADVEHFRTRMEESSVKKLGEREHAARVATYLFRQIRELDERPRTVEEEKALIQATSQYRKYAFEVLGVAEKADEDDGDF